MRARSAPRVNPDSGPRRRLVGPPRCEPRRACVVGNGGVGGALTRDNLYPPFDSLPTPTESRPDVRGEPYLFDPRYLSSPSVCLKTHLPPSRDHFGVELRSSPGPRARRSGRLTFLLSHENSLPPTRTTNPTRRTPG